MTELRQILRDPRSGGLFGLLTAAFVILQILVSAHACAAAFRLEADPALVICHGAGVSVLPDQEGADPAHGCPCGILCGAGVAFAVLPPALDLGAAYDGRGGLDLSHARDPLAPAPARLSGAPPFPTGPPASSA